MKLQNHTLVALAIGAALAAPVALAQNANANANVGANVGANAGAQVQGAANAQVPDPVPAANRAVELGDPAWKPLGQRRGLVECD